MKTKLSNFGQFEKQSALVKFLTALNIICVQRIRYKLTITSMASLTSSIALEGCQKRFSQAYVFY